MTKMNNENMKEDFDIEKEIEERGYKVSIQELDRIFYRNLIGHNNKIIHTKELINEFDVKELEDFLKEGLDIINENLEEELNNAIREGQKINKKEELENKVIGLKEVLKVVYKDSKAHETAFFKKDMFDEYYKMIGGRDTLKEIIKQLEEILK